MKRLVLLTGFTIAVISILNAQSQVVKKTLLTMQPGEKLQNSESCIELSMASGQLYVVTRKGDQIFIYEGGQRKGPFAMDAVKLKNCSDNAYTPCAVYDPDQPDAMSEMISVTSTGGMAIKFKGKTYGPYKMVTDIQVAVDKSWFVALVLQNGKFSVVSSDGQVLPIDGPASKLKVSSNGKKFLVVSKEGDGMDVEMMSMDMSKMTEEKMMEFVKKQAEKQQKAGPPQTTIISNGGKKYGPYPSANLSDNNPAFCKTGGDNWYMIMDNALYVNGIKLKQFSTDQVSLITCDTWISADGKRYAYTSYTNLVFSDGSVFPSPIRMDIEIKDGKTFLKWIGLENERNLVSYTKEL
jgi:hypothetical protein